MAYEKFISSQQRIELEKAYDLIKKVSTEISIDHVEYTIIQTTLDNLKRAIKYESKY